MTDSTSPSFGMNRRDLLKRGAVVGALTWAAPTISSLGTPAFAQTGTPFRGQAISYILLVWDCGGTNFKIKWEAADDGSGGSFATDCNANNPNCDEESNQTNWLAAEWNSATCDDTPPITTSYDGCTVTFTLTDTNCSFVQALGVDGSEFECIASNGETGASISVDDPDCN